MAAPEGRSGAALLILQAGPSYSDQYFARVTSRRRSMRELYVIDNLDSASHLRIRGRARGCDLPWIRRHFPVSMTIVPLLENCGSLLSTDICPQFDRLFASSLDRVVDKPPQNILRPLLGLFDELPCEYHSRVRSALRLATVQSWRVGLGHGDPHLTNVVKSSESDCTAVDFASGGLVVKRVHRARWVNAVHQSRSELKVVYPECHWCSEALGDDLALLIDAARRLRSEGRDPMRSNFWRELVMSLLAQVER